MGTSRVRLFSEYLLVRDSVSLSHDCYTHISFSRIMKYELVIFSLLFLVGSSTAQEQVVGVNPDDTAQTATGDENVEYWAIEPAQEEDYNGTAPIIIEPDDTWDSAVANDAGEGWNPDEDCTREGCDGYNPNESWVMPQLGDEEVVGPAMEVFDGRDVSESLATELGRGGGARGHARGQGRPDDNTRRNLRANNKKN